jgi:hypothetical protein
VPSTDEWIKKILCMYTMAFVSAINKNEMIEIQLFAEKCIKMEIIMLSEKKQKQSRNDEYHICHLWKLGECKLKQNRNNESQESKRETPWEVAVVGKGARREIRKYNRWGKYKHNMYFWKHHNETPY